jgi:hypothetical protein
MPLVGRLGAPVHCRRSGSLADPISGCSAAWQRATFGTWRPRVQIPASRPPRSPLTWGSACIWTWQEPDAHRLLTPEAWGAMVNRQPPLPRRQESPKRRHGRPPTECRAMATLTLTGLRVGGLLPEREHCCAATPVAGDRVLGAVTRSGHRRAGLSRPCRLGIVAIPRSVRGGCDGVLAAAPGSARPGSTSLSCSAPGCSGPWAQHIQTRRCSPWRVWCSRRCRVAKPRRWVVHAQWPTLRLQPGPTVRGTWCEPAPTRNGNG